MPFNGAYGDSTPKINAKQLSQCVPWGIHPKERAMWVDYITEHDAVPLDGGPDDPWVYDPDGSQLWRKLDAKGEVRK